MLFQSSFNETKYFAFVHLTHNEKLRHPKKKSKPTETMPRHRNAWEAFYRQFVDEMKTRTHCVYIWAVVVTASALLCVLASIKDVKIKIQIETHRTTKSPENAESFFFSLEEEQITLDFRCVATTTKSKYAKTKTTKQNGNVRQTQIQCENYSKAPKSRTVNFQAYFHNQRWTCFLNKRFSTSIIIMIL